MSMTKEEFLLVAGLETHTLEIWLEQEWLVPRRTEAGARFSETDAARARLIVELQRDFGANDAGIDIILHLLDQMHGMRRTLEQLRKELGRDPA